MNLRRLSCCSWRGTWRPIYSDRQHSQWHPTHRVSTPTGASRLRSGRQAQRATTSTTTTTRTRTTRTTTYITYNIQQTTNNKGEPEPEQEQQRELSRSTTSNALIERTSAAEAESYAWNRPRDPPQWGQPKGNDLPFFRKVRRNAASLFFKKHLHAFADKKDMSKGNMLLFYFFCFCVVVFLFRLPSSSMGRKHHKPTNHKSRDNLSMNCVLQFLESSALVWINYSFIVYSVYRSLRCLFWFLLRTRYLCSPRWRHAELLSLGLFAPLRIAKFGEPGNRTGWSWCFIIMFLLLLYIYIYLKFIYKFICFMVLFYRSIFFVNLFWILRTFGVLFFWTFLALLSGLLDM